MTKDNTTLEASLNQEKMSNLKEIADLESIINQLKIKDEESQAIITQLRNEN